MRCFAVVAVVAWSSIASAQGALDKAPFSATASELLAVAKTAPKGMNTAVLREEYNVTADDNGLIRTRTRVLTLLLTQTAVDEWRALNVSYDATYQDKPTLRARVIGPDGTTKDVGPANDDNDPDEDYTGISAPLPKLAIGTIIEQEYNLNDNVVPVGGGLWLTTLGNDAPTMSTRVTITGSPKLRVAAAGTNVQPKVTTQGGRQTWRYEIGTLPANKPYQPHVPRDVMQYAVIGVTTSPSWSKVASDYATIIDKAIAEGKPAMPAKVTTTPPADAVKSIARWVHGMVAIESRWLDITSPVPSTPADTMKRGKGSALDAATLMVALLRQANVQADLVLVRSTGRSSGRDLERALPTLWGFDGVLVRAVTGSTTTWIDPLLSYSTTGQVSWTLQGALAVVIGKSTTDTIVTPATTSKDNVVTSNRIYRLGELGYTSVEETIRYGGSYEAGERQWHADTTQTAARKDIEGYAKNEFSNAEVVEHSWTSPADTTVPFDVKLRANRSERGYADREEISVYLFPSDAVEDLPDMLRRSKEGDPKRTLDLQIEHPHKRIVETRLVVPPGFKMPAAAAPKKRALGPMTLVETQRIEKNELIVTFELDTVKARLTPAEVVSAQTALRALDAEGALHVVIENIGHSLLAAGKAREAIAEYERMIALHPTEGVHHGELAHAYLSVGAGLAARRAAKKGTQIEPKNADVHVMLGWVLEHDELGRRFTGNFDRAGAKAALEKAVQLDPRHIGAMTELAVLLERNARGERFDVGSDAAGAAAWYWKAFGLGAGIDTAHNYLAAQLWAGNYDKLIEHARTLKASERRDALLVAAVGASKGGEAGVQEASKLARDGAARTKTLTAASGLLMFIRSYEPMRSIFASVQASTAQTKVLADLVRSSKPFKPGKSATDAIAELMIAQIFPARRHDVFWDKHVRADFDESTRSMNALGPLNRDVMTSLFLEDLMLATIKQVNVEGDAKAMRAQLDVGKEQTRIYLVQERGAAKIIGGDKAWEGVGRYLLKVLAAGDEATATRILDWLAKDAAQMGGDMLAFAIPELWGPKLPKTKQAMELAAAVIAGKSLADRVLPLVEKCGAQTTTGQEVCDMVAADCLVHQQRWNDLEDHAKQWQSRTKSQNPMPAVYRVRALVRRNSLAEAETVIDEALTNAPDNPTLLSAKAEVAIGRGQLAEGVKRLEAAAASSSSALHKNNLAWLMLVEGTDLKGALEVAQKAQALAPSSTNALHTLASIEAETGDLVNAWKHAVDAFTRTAEGAEGTAALYVHGRILEAVGLKDDAIATYKKTKRDPQAGVFPDSYELAQKRLKKLKP